MPKPSADTGLRTGKAERTIEWEVDDSEGL
jgi:hypothetical protein